VKRTEQRVQIFSIGVPRDGTPRDKRRYRVRWRVDGRDKTRAFGTKAQAERLRARLQLAVADGEEFDLAGLPISWIKQDKTWWEWSQEWLCLKWLQWSGHSRRSAVESLVAITPLMGRDGAPPAPEEVVTWLREHGYHPWAMDQERRPGWLLRWSVPLVEIEQLNLSGSLRRSRPRGMARPR
jgi:hypothetical protein